MDGPEILIPLFAVVTIFIGLPWIVFHYITKWKTSHGRKMKSVVIAMIGMKSSPSMFV